MFDCVKESPCTRCIHKDVCIHKKYLLKVINEINEEGWTKDYNCIADITVSCRYRETNVNYRSMKDDN